MPMEVSISFAERLRELAAADPNSIAVSSEERSLSRGELATDSDARARELIHLGVRRGDYVCLVLPNGVEFVSCLVAVWKAGGVPVPLSDRLTSSELADLLDLIDPRVVVGGEPGQVADRTHLPADRRPALHPEIDLDRTAVSPAWKALGSGGSTGRPKVIVAHESASLSELPVGANPVGLRERDVCAITAPLSHNGPFYCLVHTLLLGGRAVLTGRFDPEKTLAVLEREKVTWLYLVPTMMGRIAKLPDEVRARYDLAALRTIMHTAAPCPAWLKQAWIDWLGPDRMLELYASTEATVVFVATGREWLERPGTVGLARGGEVQVRSPEGAVLGADQFGKIWVRRHAELGPSYRYMGANAEIDGAGWETLGDMGRLDADGYLFVEDRETDMMLVGGFNVYPAEIESALLEHPAVIDCCVVGLPHDDLGQVPHALVYASTELDEAELTAHAGARLTRYKVPRSYEFVDSVLRDAAGKVRRSRLRDERISASGSTT
jgi:bile acid-coenzyme A ligase